MTFAVLLVPSGGFTGAITISCTGIANVTCSGNANVVDSNAVSTTVTVNGSSATAATGQLLMLRATATTGAFWQAQSTLDVVTTALPVLTELPTALRQPGAKVFRWTPGQNLTGYRLRIRDSSGTVYDATTNNRFSEPIPVRPLCPNPPSCPSYGLGASWWVRITGYNGDREVGTTSEWQFSVFDQIPPAIITQPSTSTLLSSGATFYLGASPGQGTIPGSNRLRFGTLGPGSTDIHDTGGFSGPQFTLPPGVVIPTNRPVYVTLEGAVDGSWGMAKDYTYNGPGVSPGLGPGGSTGVVSVAPQPRPTTIPPGGTVTLPVNFSAQGTFSGGVTVSCTSAIVTCTPGSAGLVSGVTSQVPVVFHAASGTPRGYATVSVDLVSRAGGVIVGSTPVTMMVGAPNPRSADGEEFVVIGEGERVYDWFADPNATPWNEFDWTCGSTDGVTCRVFDVGVNRLRVAIQAHDGARSGSRQYSLTAKDQFHPYGTFPSPARSIMIYDGAPTITNVYPSRVRAGDSGVSFRVEGRNFGINTSPNAVPQRLSTGIPGATLNIKVWTASLVTADLSVPSDAEGGTYTVALTSTGSTGSSNFRSAPQSQTQSQVQVQPAPATPNPVISSLEPRQVAPNRTGVTLTIRGRNFGNSPAVAIANASNVSAVQSNDSSIEVRLDTTGMAVGNNPVRVTADGRASDDEPLETVCAKPINYRQTSAGPGPRPGSLRFVYTWESTTGDRADLNTCQLREVVTYPQDRTITLPNLTRRYMPLSPPYWTALFFPNPTIVPNPAIVNGNADWDPPDTHSLGTNNPIFVRPFRPDYFEGLQTYEYRCTCEVGTTGDFTPFPGFRNVPISRSISPVDERQTIWKFEVKKNGETNKIEPLQYQQ